MTDLRQVEKFILLHCKPGWQLLQISEIKIYEGRFL